MKTIFAAILLCGLLSPLVSMSQTTKPASSVPAKTTLKHDQIKSFADGWAAFKSGNVWGYVDTQGKIVIEPRFEGETYYKFGLIHVAMDLQKKAKIYDKEGKLALDSEPYFRMNGFTDSLYTTACTFGDGAKGIKPVRYVIDRTGKIFSTIEIDYTAAGSIYCTQTPYDGRIWFQVKDDYRKKGYMDVKGNKVIPAQYIDVKDFNNNRAWVKSKQSDGRELWGAIDTNGRVCVAFQYTQEQQVFKNHRCFVYDGATYSLIDTAGKVLSEVKFKKAAPFSSTEVTTVKIEENWEEVSAIVDYNGKLVKKFEKPAPGTNKEQIFLKTGFRDGLAVASYGQFGKCGAVDKTGKDIIPFEFETIEGFSCGRALATRTEKSGATTEGFIDTKGNFIIVKQ
jgi:hypothetical protein